MTIVEYTCLFWITGEILSADCGAPYVSKFLNSIIHIFKDKRFIRIPRQHVVARVAKARLFGNFTVASWPERKIKRHVIDNAIE